MTTTREKSEMVRGSCLCGGVRFEADAVPLLTHCHCSNCRKLSGAAFRTYAHVEPAAFRFLQGEDLIQGFESSPGSFRSFCRVCGSPVPGRTRHLHTVSVPAGALNDDPGVRPALHTFMSSKAPWWEANDDLPKFETWVPGFEPKPDS
jgi:hypothetical protein